MSILTNTTDLQAVLEKVNLLPDAGSGGGTSIETCTVSITDNTNGTLSYYCILTDTEENDLQLESSKSVTLSNIPCTAHLLLIFEGDYYNGVIVSNGSVIYNNSNSMSMTCLAIVKLNGSSNDVINIVCE